MPLKQTFDFNNLFIFEMANNHQGSVEHGKRIISEIADIVKAKGIRGAIKFQFRDLDSFVHPAFMNMTENKHIPRFLATRLFEEQYAELAEEAKRRELIVISTPFDEMSVDKIERLGIEIIKIASCSAGDWPLLERVAQTGKPVICSTGGLKLKDIDKIVSFFQHKGVSFALMHCVAVYPTPNDRLALNQIEIMRQRYPKIVIGFSTHEEPANMSAIKLAYAKGARIYEKHVGVAADKILLNAYSATPAQAAAWVDSWQEAVAACGSETEREISEKEASDLLSLKRGVYARRAVKKGQPLSEDDVFYAMPVQPGQLLSGQLKESMLADRDYAANEAISETIFKNFVLPSRYLIAHYVQELKAFINIARITVGTAPDVELSHHYGLERFHDYGAAIIDCINREYCKKIIIQLPGQNHPSHYHSRKEETFQILYGILISKIDGLERIHHPGDVVLVPRGAWHSFRSEQGAIFEEISTTHYNDDSFYEDRTINQLKREDRKTKLINWGFRQFN